MVKSTVSKVDPSQKGQQNFKDVMKSEALQPMAKVGGETPSMTHLNANQMSSIDKAYASVTEATVTNRFGAVNKIDEKDSDKIVLTRQDSDDE